MFTSERYYKNQWHVYNRKIHLETKLKKIYLHILKRKNEVN